MKELERERDALLHGLEMVDRTRVWYLQQIHGVKGRQDQAKRGFGDTDRPIDSRPNRACLLLAKIQEVNSCLSDLISTPGQTQYIHHPANVLPGKVTGIHRQSVGTLQEQNRLLTKELSVKSGRITALEMERAALIKRLIDVQNQGFSESSCEGSTII
ncbi:suppressor APC domain-containing protein 2-like [Amblyraja radiata]|uniref:suppressor APC domain-containing protein 2-like n=1 Tax=Amblyraja radiata TaxID=386614 RepID=UPI001401CA61|nr:suppressor APC domain-containing protein 2-like [Amblyraja radiata]